MNDLLQIKNNEAVCTSLQIAEKFNKRHKNVIRDIEKLIFNALNFEPVDELSEEEVNRLKECVKYFKLDTYTDEKGEKRPMYYMNKQGFSILAMGFTGKKALAWKIQYMQAFEYMERVLSERNTQLWIEQRKQGKITRKAETDVIQKLVKYAKEQGSKHSQMLYMTYSKLANKMAGIKDRDMATMSQLNELSFIENIILHQIHIGMEKEMHYKDIYQDCKRQIELFKDVAYLNVG